MNPLPSSVHSGIAETINKKRSLSTVIVRRWGYFIFLVFSFRLQCFEVIVLINTRIKDRPWQKDDHFTKICDFCLRGSVRLIHSLATDAPGVDRCDYRIMRIAQGELIKPIFRLPPMWTSSESTITANPTIIQQDSRLVGAHLLLLIGIRNCEYPFRKVYCIVIFMTTIKICAYEVSVLSSLFKAIDSICDPTK